MKRLLGALMRASVYRVAGGWAVKTPEQELICSSIHDAMDVAFRHAKAAGYEAINFRSGPFKAV